MRANGRTTSAPSQNIPIGVIPHDHMLPDGNMTVIYQNLDWDWKKYPHALLVGGTGSGKTTCLKWLIAQFAYREPQSEIYLATYKPKAEDFAYLEPCEYFADYQDSKDLFNRYFDRFKCRLDGSDSARTPLVLFFDEWVGFLLSLNKKEQDELLSKMGQLLMLGRSLKVIIILAMQRPDAVFFKNGARDNFNVVIALGNMSSEGQRMIFTNDCISQIQPCNEIGTGYVLIGGYEFNKICIPPPKKAADYYIKNKLSRNGRKVEKNERQDKRFP